MMEQVSIQISEFEFIQRHRDDFLELANSEIQRVLPPMYKVIDVIEEKSQFNKDIIFVCNIIRIEDEKGQYLFFNL